MAIRYYDEALVKKLEGWLPDKLEHEDSPIRVLKPDETSRLFKIKNDENKDEPITLPVVSVSRDTSFELLETTKSPLSFDGKKIGGDEKQTIKLNAVPISIFYQIDIFTKHYENADTILRELILKLLNNPKMVITLPYNGVNLQHVCYTRLSSTVTDNSDISERLFPGQFTRWTIQLEIKDAYLFSIPVRKNWKMDEEEPIGDSMVGPIENGCYEIVIDEDRE